MNRLWETNRKPTQRTRKFYGGTSRENKLKRQDKPLRLVYLQRSSPFESMGARAPSTDRIPSSHPLFVPVVARVASRHVGASRSVQRAGMRRADRASSSTPGWAERPAYLNRMPGVESQGSRPKIVSLLSDAT